MLKKKETKPKTLLNRSIIIGCGKLGGAIANERWKEGKNVIVIDPDPDSFAHLDRDFSGEAIVASATDIKKLVEAGISSASEVVITTGDDNINIFLAFAIATMYCHGIDIFVRLDDATRGVVLEDLPVTPIYPLDLSLQLYKSYKSGGER